MHAAGDDRDAGGAGDAAGDLGSASATNAIGPAAAVTGRDQRDPDTMMARRIGSVRVPVALAASSPSSNCRRPRVSVAMRPRGAAVMMPLP